MSRRAAFSNIQSVLSNIKISRQTKKLEAEQRFCNLNNHSDLSTANHRKKLSIKSNVLIVLNVVGQLMRHPAELCELLSSTVAHSFTKLNQDERVTSSFSTYILVLFSYFSPMD